LEGEIKELKAMDDEELKKLAKTEEVQVLEANMHVLERQLDFERGQWTELYGKYKELMDRFFVLDHWEGVSLANAIQKKLDKHLDEQFHQRISMEVTNVATQDRVFPHYVPNSSIRHSKSDSKDRSQEIL
jgi:hypothetical protein